MANGTNLHISLFGDDEVVARLTRSVRSLEDGSPWFRMMHEWLEQQMQKQFDTQGSHLGGQRWKQLADSTLAMKSLAGVSDMRILRGETGDLMASLTKPGGHAVRYVSPHVMVFGSTVDYGKYHQSKLPRKKKADGSDLLPRRPILNLSLAGDRRAIARSLGLYIARHQLRPPSAMSRKV